MKKNTRKQIVDSEMIWFDVDGTFDNFYRNARWAYGCMDREIDGCELTNLSWTAPSMLTGCRISVNGKSGALEHGIFVIQDSGSEWIDSWRINGITRVSLTTFFVVDRDLLIRWRAEWLSYICKKHPEVRIGIERHVADSATKDQHRGLSKLPTDPNDPQLNDIPEDHRPIVAMTNQGLSPRQIHDRQPNLGRDYIDGVLHDTRKHPLRAYLVKPAKKRVTRQVKPSKDK